MSSLEEIKIELKGIGDILFVGCVGKYMSFVEVKRAGQPNTGTCDMIKEDKSI